MEQPAVLYHASQERNLETLGPRAESVRDPEEGPVVFATPDRTYAACFLVPTDDSWVAIGRFSTKRSAGPWWIVISDRKRFEQLDTGGAIYTLPRKTFYSDPKRNMPGTEWVSRTAVKPIGKELFASGLIAMKGLGVKIYFVDEHIFHRLQTADDHGKSVIDKLTPI